MKLWNPFRRPEAPVRADIQATPARIPSTPKRSRPIRATPTQRPRYIHIVKSASGASMDFIWGVYSTDAKASAAREAIIESEEGQMVWPGAIEIAKMPIDPATPLVWTGD